MKVSYSDVGEGEVAVNCEKNTIFPEHPVCILIFLKDKDNNSVMDLARKLGPEGKEVYQALIDTTQNKVLLPILDTFNKNIFDISGR